MAKQFQYMALARFAQKVQRRRKDAEQARKAAEQSSSEERKQRKHAQQRLKDAVAGADESAGSLQKAEAQLKKWKDRQPYINHYLGLVKTMSEYVQYSPCPLISRLTGDSDLSQMRSQLLELGYRVPQRDYSFKDTNHVDVPADRYYGVNQPGPPNAKRFSSSSTAGKQQVGQFHDLR